MVNRTERELPQYINTIDQANQFAVEVTRPDGSMPFFDKIITPEHNIIMSISIYRKPTNRDQYL